MTIGTNKSWTWRLEWLEYLSSLANAPPTNAQTLDNYYLS